jgi:hypothetical protein
MKRVRSANKPCGIIWFGGANRWATGLVDSERRRGRGCISRSSGTMARRWTLRRNQLIRPESQPKRRQTALRRDERGRLNKEIVLPTTGNVQQFGCQILNVSWVGSGSVSSVPPVLMDRRLSAGR